MCSRKPTIGIVGASGYVGKFVTGAFLTALNEGRLQEVRILIAKKTDVFLGFEKEGAKFSPVDYSDQESLVTALKGIDIVVSAMGTGPGTGERKKALVNALAEAGTKIYFPSEFGTNHYNRVKHYKHPLFEAKKEHFKEAQGKGIKTIGILCSDIMETTFGSWFGLDNKTEVWTLVGNGEVPVAVTAERDVGRFTVEAAILAFQTPNTIPDLIEVYSTIRTMREYAKEFDKVAGRSTELKFVPLDKAVDDYDSDPSFEALLQILFEEGAYNYSDAKGNELLNPGEKLWKLKTIEEYAQETKGRPWRDAD